MTKQEERWDETILPTVSLFDLKLKEIWNYRDLLILFVRRDFVTLYKQTLLGPLWFFIQPFLMTLVFTVVFGQIAKISTDGLPQVLFYLSGITIWNYFSDCMTSTSNVFRSNVGLFGKVYFPRMIVPLSMVVSNLIRFGIQFLLLSLIFLYYYLNGMVRGPNSSLLLFPYLILLLAMLSLGLGLFISSLTAKYRDLNHLVSFGLRMMMYLSPVILPMSALPERFKIFILANPMTPIIETFRYSLLGTGSFTLGQLAYSSCFAVISLILGVLFFNQTQQSFIDTV